MLDVSARERRYGVVVVVVVAFPLMEEELDEECSSGGRVWGEGDAERLV